MKILFVTQYYHPEYFAGALRATEHSKYWYDWGMDITVYTAIPNYPLGQIYDGYRPRLLCEDRVNGVRVLRGNIHASSNKTLLKRVLGGVSFMAYGIVNNIINRDKIGKGYEAVYASSGTVFAGVLGLCFAKSYGCPFVIEFRDLTYKQLIASSGSRDNVKVRLMRWLELGLCKNASHVVVGGEGVKDYLVNDGVEKDIIIVAHNGADCVECKKTQSSSIRFGYFGAMGLVHDVIKTLDYLAKIKSDGFDIDYLLIGEGSCRQAVEERVSSEDCSFVKLMHGMQKDELEAYYKEIDIAVVSVAECDGYSIALPVKMFYALARGVPVLYIGPFGEAAVLIEEADAGIALCSSDEENLLKLHTFLEDEDIDMRLVEMGENAQRVMQERYSREVAARRIAEVLDNDAAKCNKRA